MATKLVLEAQQRERAGKGSSRAVRREGRVPAVIYGDKKDPVIITLETKEVLKELRKGTFFTSICDLTIDKDKHRVLARDVQLHPINDEPIHIDFLRVTPKTRITVNVPVTFVDEEEAPGLRDEGGILNVARHEVEVECRATDIPDELVVSLKGMEIGDNIDSTSIDLPDGVVFTIDDRDFAIAGISAPRILKTPEEEEAELQEAIEAEAEALAEGEEGEGEGEEGEEGEAEAEESKE